MVELFPNISDTTRKRVEFWLNILLTPHTEAIQTLEEVEKYRSTLNDEEKEYMDFVFQTKIAMILGNENAITEEEYDKGNTN